MKRKFIKILSTLFPGFMVDFAYGQLTNPQLKKLRKNEMAVLDRSEKEILDFKGFKIQLYHWEAGPEKVMLVHGWEGQAGNFSDLIEGLLKQNISVVAFDAPSHGFSSTGKTSLFDFIELTGILIKKFEVSKLVSHSFGGVATTYSLYNNPTLAIEKYVLLTTPDKFSERIDDVVDQVGLTQKVKNKLIDRIEKESDVKVNSLCVSNFVRKVNVQKAFIIHDKNDKIIPIHRAKNVHENWNNCELQEIEGTGHFRILRTDFVIDQAVSFLKYHS